MKKSKKTIYFDYAATTPVDPRVMKVMQRYFNDEFGNASSIHTVGQESARAVDRARASIAKFLGCKPGEVIFTSGATESNNTAIKGAVEALKKYGDHIITSSIEHPCVLESCKYLEKKGFRVTYLPVYKNGVIRVSDFKKAITSKTILASIMYVNNEIGTIQPIAEIAAAIRNFRSSKSQTPNSKQISPYGGSPVPQRGISRRETGRQNSKFKIQKHLMPVFHCDATQAVNYLDCNVDRLGVDLLSMSGHKIYGPKGVGALYVRRGTPMAPLLHGGHQEYGIRAGTLNHVGIAGFGKAIEIIHKNIKTLKHKNKRVENQRIRKLRDEIIDTVLTTIPDSRLNGDRTKRVANNVNISFDRVEGEALLMLLDMEGIAVSTGSACASGSLEPSHVLMALGLTPVQAHGSIRVTLGRFTKESDIKKLLAVLPKAVARLRGISF